MDVVQVVGFVSTDFALGTIRIGAFSLWLGLCASLVAVPFLLSTRIRSLFRRIGPFSGWVGNYTVWMTVIGGGEIALFAFAADVIAVEYADPAVVERLITTASAVLVVGYVLLLLVLLLVVLPRLGINWPEQYDRRTVGLIVGGVLWYHAGTVLLSPYAFDWLMSLARPG
ncbi:hypothetical protein [Halocatena pleomorpha]|uniref:DUF8162 domain-containing protein n=1 Tax=Halocatena pleomorpha TaxID=1785090 RepID=A0A3P3RL18_9EURY|nr:hypothetical protein [Halocatena pleomorpha]RRJ33588.1 hypothetical protein EIK79_01975 [Halocatena pleomorpha]